MPKSATPIRLLPAAALLLCLFSCAPSGEPRVLEEREFATVYARLARAGISAREAGGDTSLARLRADSILSRSGVTRADLEATVRWYNEDVRRWKGFYDEVVAAMDDSLRR